MLADRPEAEVRRLLARTGMRGYTEHTITDPDRFIEALAETRERGYALDEGEQEVGVRCVAVAVPDAPQPMALSMSGPLPRMGDDVVRRAAPVLHETAAAISAELNRIGATADA
jgi:IclR family acetate operon transcriptional repressor